MNDDRLQKASQNKKWKQLYELSETIISAPMKSVVAKFRLATGHDYLVCHLHVLKIFPSPSCVLCDSEEDHHHHHHWCDNPLRVLAFLKILFQSSLLLALAVHIRTPIVPASSVTLSCS